MKNLQSNSCKACDDLLPPLTQEQINTYLKELHTNWFIDEDKKTLSRRFEFKGYAKAIYLSGLVAFLSDKEGHHADVSFGWGYFQVTYTSHELGQLSENDFICATKLDAITDS